jgi:GT2 family glycosyltransferase
MSLVNKVSVVIPTLGGNCLEVTIKQLNQGTLIPEEILVCIPEEYLPRIESYRFDNLKILPTRFKGQVGQRAYGFARVNNNLVLQLDDDILLKETCLEKLVNFILENPGSAVGPKFLDRSNGKYHSYLYKDKNESTLFDKISFFILNGRLGCRPGQLSKAGLFFGIPEKPDYWFEAGWLPGGCVLHRKDNLILDDYYPVKGKAYWEDIFHSDLLRKNGIKLHRAGDAICTLDFTANQQINIIFFINEFWKVSNIILIYIKKNRLYPIRIILFHFCNTFILIFRKLIKLIKINNSY